MESFAIGGANNFTYQGAGLGDLGSTDYTLATIAVDVTGSVYEFSDELLKSLKTAVTACKKSPRSDNLLVRVVIFSSMVGVRELHGFKLLRDIDVDRDYQPFQPDGMTPLYDAALNCVSVTESYGQNLADNDFLVNAILFVITDGVNNDSHSATPGQIKAAIGRIRKDEALESVISILVGINATDCRDWLEAFRAEAGFDQYVDVADASPQRLARLAAFVSQSISSQSQALGTGGPSQSIAATI